MLVAESTPALPHPVARSRGSNGQQQGRQAREQRASRRGAASSTRSPAWSPDLAGRRSGRNGGRRRLARKETAGHVLAGRRDELHKGRPGWVLRRGWRSPVSCLLRRAGKTTQGRGSVRDGADGGCRKLHGGRRHGRLRWLQQELDARARKRDLARQRMQEMAVSEPRGRNQTMALELLLRYREMKRLGRESCRHEGTKGEGRDELAWRFR